MNREYLLKIRTIGEALHSSHNTVTTDSLSATPDKTHWVIDNSKAISALDEIEQVLSNSKGICPLCCRYNKSL